MRRFGLSHLRNVLRDRFYDAEDSLIYVHIGKCGGKSLWKAIEKSDVVQSRFRFVRRIHTSKPPVFRRTRYLFVIRNPLARTVSAFNWRYKLVVEDAAQKDRFPGERAVLQRYGSISNLGEALYDGERLNTGAARDFSRIHHLREDICFYLDALLKTITRDQIVAVLITERLNEDIRAVLGVDWSEKVHENRPAAHDKQTALSDRAEANLRRYLQPEYDCIERLLQLHPLDEAARAALLR